MPHEKPAPSTVEAFIAKWSESQAAERANAQSFLIDLCDVLGVPHPEPKGRAGRDDDYVFERDIPYLHEDGTETKNFIDLYKAGAFVLEAKQGSNEGAGGHGKREKPQWHAAMQKAHGQALGYAKSFDDPPPFVVVCDVGYCFDLYAQFDGSGIYRPFPNAQRHRIHLKNLDEHLDTLRALWTDPLSLDPSRRATKITREVAGHLAELAKDLEAAGHLQQQVTSLYRAKTRSVSLAPGSSELRLQVGAVTRA